MISVQLTPSIIPLSPTLNLRSRHRLPYSSTNAFSSSLSNIPRLTRLTTLQPSSHPPHQQNQQEYQLLSALTTPYNHILVLESADSRILLLDSSHNVHSILNKHQKWTQSYWDEFASLPAIVPEGPIAILGLGGGTAAHLMLDLWPSLELHGWEIDSILIDKARDYFGLSDLEKQNQAGGVLHVHIGDALNPSENEFGGYSGIIVDLFCEGKVLSELQEVTTWLQLNDRLLPNGRLMVNCGGIDNTPDVNGSNYPSKADCSWVDNSTIKALSTAFPGQLNWKRLPDGDGANYMALTGPLPDLTSWSDMVPPPLNDSVKKWRPCPTL